jgi:light-independent protochlorophyllide reductase subunit B
MGLEEHLLHMFREDFEFHDEAGPSHHAAHAPAQRPAAAAEAGGAAPRPAAPDSPRDISTQEEGPAGAGGIEIVWRPAAEKELKKIPFFVRGKAKRNTEAFARERGVAEIDVDTLYEAKAHYAR